MSDINETPRSEEQIIVSIELIKQSLKKGLTRRIGDPNYNAEIGSIQELYNINKAEVTALFQDPRLKGLKVSVPKPSRIVIAEDTVTPTEGIPSGAGTNAADIGNDSEMPVSGTHIGDTS